MDTPKTEVAPFDHNAAPTVGEQGELMELDRDSEYDEYLAYGCDVYKSALLGADNSIPKNNRLIPPISDIVYADSVNWHPCTIGVNAGTRVNNVRVNYNGPMNVYRKFTCQ